MSTSKRGEETGTPHYI